MKKKISKTKNIDSVKYRSVSFFPSKCFESKLNIICSQINSIPNFYSEIDQNEISNLAVEFKGNELNWTYEVPAFSKIERTAFADSLIFPRHDCAGISMNDLYNFPLVITAVEGAINQEYVKYYLPTFRFLNSTLIMVDLLILGPSEKCPSGKYDEYYEELISEFEDDKIILEEEATPRIGRTYVHQTTKGRSLVTGNPTCILASFLLDNIYSSFGDLLLDIDDAMSVLDAKIIKSI